MKPIYTIIALLFLFANINCGSNSSKTSGTDSDTSGSKMSRKDNGSTPASDASTPTPVTGGGTAAVENNDPGHKYGIPAAVITYQRETSTGPVKIMSKEILYFNDFGHMECRETYTTNQMNGIEEKEKVMILRDGYVFTYSPKTKYGTRSKISSNTTGPEAMMDIEQIKRNYKYTELPEEPVCGKQCKAIEVTMPMGKGKLCIWNRIILSMIMNEPKTGMNIELKATNIEEKGHIEPVKFDMPAGINFTER